MKEKPERRWYIVQTYSGYENRVKANLEQRIASMGMGDKIFNVLVPVEERIYVKGGKANIRGGKSSRLCFGRDDPDDRSWCRGIRPGVMVLWARGPTPCRFPREKSRSWKIRQRADQTES